MMKPQPSLFACLHLYYKVQDTTQSLLLVLAPTDGQKTLEAL